MAPSSTLLADGSEPPLSSAQARMCTSAPHRATGRPASSWPATSPLRCACRSPMPHSTSLASVRVQNRSLCRALKSYRLIRGASVCTRGWISGGAPAGWLRLAHRRRSRAPLRVYASNHAPRRSHRRGAFDVGACAPTNSASHARADDPLARLTEPPEDSAPDLGVARVQYRHQRWPHRSVGHDPDGQPPVGRPQHCRRPSARRHDLLRDHCICPCRGHVCRLGRPLRYRYVTRVRPPMNVSPVARY